MPKALGKNQRRPCRSAAVRLRDDAPIAGLREALAESAPGDVITVHAADCPQTTRPGKKTKRGAARCNCDPVRLIVGARA